ncbi:MAG: hydroxymyristoyl-ACP dehydratase [Pseudozobellia sp.]|mgnify:CR=1 FL=1|nr:hydroxymyristoyl-ACP dehydratase [Pseudozobellia sp.]
MSYEEILDQLPYTEPFLFVDGLNSVSDDGTEGFYTFPSDAYFYEGHFKNHSVTPGVLLTECCAQIGLVCLGIFLLKDYDNGSGNLLVAMSSAEMEYLAPVFPGEKVTVTSEKVYFRFNKLKCQVKMFNAKKELVCKGTISGMFKKTSSEQQ